MHCLSIVALGLTFFSLNAAAVPLALPGMLTAHTFMPSDIIRKLTVPTRSPRIAHDQSPCGACGRLGVANGSSN